MDCYFRQKWKDERLKFNRFATQSKQDVANISLSIKMLDKIWKPDTYFLNGKGSYLHTITQPNKLLRISHNGDVLYSMRLTIKAKCPMKLESFPMDRQSCPLWFGSYAYPEEQIRFEWINVEFVKGMVLSQYDLIEIPKNNVSHRVNSDMHSMLVVYFNLHRHMGYFLIQVYVPCILLVVLSWVSFWINREATADRVGLGITTVLTLSTFGSDTRTDLPKVAYPTALDWFVIMCFAFVMLTLLEYAGVHYFTKVGSGEYFPGQEGIEDDSEQEFERCDMEDDDDDDPQYLKRGHSDVERYVWTEVNACNQVSCYPQNTDFGTGNAGMRYRACSAPFVQTSRGSIRIQNVIGGTGSLHPLRSGTQQPIPAMQYIPPPPRPARRRVNRWLQFLYCIAGNKRYRDEMRRSAPRGQTANSVSKIDRCSRILFPVSFIVLNVLYWVGYTQFAEDGWQRTSDT
ncbi:gamma-aminobutyric acid receptor alpha-like isoform X1 [Varroa destructor]|nr:gamma-aminobutyric acid receptor alpha-like isoform X1 [Varroa destructor]